MRGASNHGFALPLVLVAVAVVALSVASLAQTGLGRVKAAKAETERFAANLAAETAQARIAHLIATEPLGARSLEVAMQSARSRRVASGRDLTAAQIFLDGRPYALSLDNGPPLIVRLQDEAGLLNMNGASERAIARFLEGGEVSAPDAGRLAVALADFLDQDDLRRPGSLDGPDYARAGLGLVRNRALEDPRQALAAAGWAEKLPSSKFDMIIQEAAALPPGASFNPNTATHRALRSVFAFDATSADRVIAAREQQLLLNADDVIALTGAVEFDSNIQARPAASIILMMDVPRNSHGEIYIYATRIFIAQGVADRPIEFTRLKWPARVISRERARTNDHAQLVSLPVSASLLAP
jgi:type II secretory pathway component PulK